MRCGGYARCGGNLGCRGDMGCGVGYSCALLPMGVEGAWDVRERDVEVLRNTATAI